MRHLVRTSVRLAPEQVFAEQVFDRQSNKCSPEQVFDFPNKCSIFRTPAGRTAPRFRKKSLDKVVETCVRRGFTARPDLPSGQPPESPAPGPRAARKR